MAYEEKHVLRDGRVLIYKRNASPYYQVRLNLSNKAGYIVRSTKSKHIAEACRFAEDLYDDLSYKARHGIEIYPHSFETLWKRWYEHHHSTLSESRLKYITGTANRYLLPYFADTPVEGITQAKVSGYWNWRLNYWSSEEGKEKIEFAQKSRSTEKRPYKQRLGNVAKIPAKKTLQMEQSVIRQILKWSHIHGLIDRVPDVKAPKIAGQTGDSRRPAFTLKEFQTIYRFMRGWVNEDARTGMKDKRPNSHHIYHRRMFRRYFLFMGVSGLRPNEARQLKWKDVQHATDRSGKSFILLKIAQDTKTGKRDCVPLKSAAYYLDDIRSFSLHTEPDDLLFCDKKGLPIENFGKTMKSVLEQLNLREDGYGKARTIYSLRHTYATFVLLYGHGNIELLAQNMGTSPIQIFKHYRHITVQQKASELSGKLHPDLSTKGLYF